MCKCPEVPFGIKTQLAIELHNSEHLQNAARFLDARLDDKQFPDSERARVQALVRNANQEAASAETGYRNTISEVANAHGCTLSDLTTDIRAIIDEHKIR